MEAVKRRNRAERLRAFLRQGYSTTLEQIKAIDSVDARKARSELKRQGWTIPSRRREGTRWQEYTLGRKTA